MKNISVVKKTKEKKFYRLENGVEELDNVKFSDYIPKYAKQIEIKYIARDNILMFDYILELSTTKEE